MVLAIIHQALSFRLQLRHFDHGVRQQFLVLLRELLQLRVDLDRCVDVRLARVRLQVRLQRLRVEIRDVLQ
jgi:hypothetical protein